jgi:hypothetical protein
MAKWYNDSFLSIERRGVLAAPGADLVLAEGAKGMLCSCSMHGCSAGAMPRCRG